MANKVTLLITSEAISNGYLSPVQIEIAVGRFRLAGVGWLTRNQTMRMDLDDADAEALAGALYRDAVEGEDRVG